MYDIQIDSSSELTAYIIYMIMGSYFKKTVCMSGIKERQLKVVYCETKRNIQMNMEEKCINYVDNKVVLELPEGIFDEIVEFHFVPNTKDHKLEAVFLGSDWKLRMWGGMVDKNLRFDYKFISNNKTRKEGNING